MRQRFRPPISAPARPVARNGCSKTWLYLAGHKDIFTKEIVGYAMDGCMTKSLVNKSLFNAVKTKRPAAGLTHHSDRGSQYCSGEYRKLLEHFGMKSSMSGKVNCYDNAPMESFWGTLKSELVHHRRYRTRQEAIQEITEYIEVFSIAREDRPAWDSYPPLPMNNSSIQ